jgi:hypothetical protein
MNSNALALSVAALGMIIGWSGASTALASPPSITLSGFAADGHTPDTNGNGLTLKATLSGGVASGSLRTVGPVFFHYGDNFEGNVSCIAVNGNRVVVGAVGIADKPGREIPSTQVVTLEFRKFRYRNGPERQTLFESFGALGEYDQGLPGSEPPSCAQSYSFANQNLPTWENYLYMAPSITSPVDGYVSHTGTVKLHGTGEAKRTVKVYEVGHEASGAEVKVNAMGHWKLTLSGLSPGTHTFTAKAVNGSEAPANTVEVKVA